MTGAETLLAATRHASTDGVSISATVSESGVIAFREVSAADAQPRRLSEFDRSGKETATGSARAPVMSPTMSPDGRTSR